MTNTFSVGELYDENNIRHARDLGCIVGEAEAHSEYEVCEGFFMPTRENCIQLH